MRIGSLFSGYGGLDMGIQSVLGGDTAWFVEFDKAPSRILAHHWPDVPNLGDVTKVDWRSVPKVDVITGGSPCQDLSHAGKRAGMTEGTRSNLWVQMRECIAALRPRLVVWENVRGALSAPADSDLEPCPGCVGDADDGPVLRALGRVLGDLSELGYDAWWTSLRAADVGAAHGRFRVFVFAWPADAESNTRRLINRDGGAAGDAHGPARERCRPGEAGGEERAGAGEAWAAVRGEPGSADSGPSGGLTLLPTPEAHLSGSTPEAHLARKPGRTKVTALNIVVEHLLPTPAVNDMGAAYTPETWDEWTAKMQAAHGNGNGHGKSLSIEAQRLLPTPAARDWKDHRVEVAAHRPDDADNLNRAIAHLPPTPRATDGTKGGPNQRGSSGGLMLPSAVNLLPTPTGGDSVGVGYATEWAELTEADGRHRLRDAANLHAHHATWGDYGPAITRWEHVIGRPAPDPTEPGVKGNPRLSPRFVEWLMGLPAGHVTDVDISRNNQLKALGNGVVPQQAAAALRAFVQDFEALTGAAA